MCIFLSAFLPVFFFWCVEAHKAAWPTSLSWGQEVVKTKGTDYIGTKEVAKGWEVESKQGRADFIKYLDEDYENSIQVTFMQDLKHEAITVFIVLEENVGPRAVYGTAAGLCGGGKQATPCAKCKAVQKNVVKSICECKEHTLKLAKQLFSKPKCRGFRKELKPTKLSNTGVKKNLEKCKQALLSHPAGKAFYKTTEYKTGLSPAQYKELKRQFDADVDDCALDKTAVKPGVSTAAVGAESGDHKPSKMKHFFLVQVFPKAAGSR